MVGCSCWSCGWCLWIWFVDDQGKKKDEVVIETTREIIKERTHCMCPVLGNAYYRNDVANEIRMVNDLIVPVNDL